MAHAPRPNGRMTTAELVVGKALDTAQLVALYAAVGWTCPKDTLEG